jgi:small subunit ribosomal protein S1
MSNPEPPPSEQTAASQPPEAAPPPEAPAAETSAPATEQHDTATETTAAATNGENGEAAHAEENGEVAAAEGQPGAPTGEKKRRRRRRKKKGAHADANAPGAGAEGEQGGEEAKDGEGAAAEAQDPNAAPKLERRKREKKAGPPRERPPVNLGDIVFGKIVEITDEAILIDIPGKAKAIFDRREMLLPEDDEAPPAPSPAVEAATATEEEKTEEEKVAAEASPTAETATATEAAPEIGTEAASAPEQAPAAEETAAPEAAEEQAAPEPVKEPKLPHVTLEVGAEFIAVVHNDGGRGGLVVLTHHPHRAERAKPRLEAAFNDKTHVDGLVTGAIKGGIEVDVDGLRAFAPGSHVDLHLGADLHYLVGKRLPFTVTQYAKRGRDVVLSRRSMIEEEAKKARAEALEKLKVGEERDGIVRSVVPFGAFVDVGGIEGLVPLQEMSHNRSDGPSDVFKAGETTRVKVIKIDDKGKIWLSHKATIPDPWQQVAQKYAQGTKHAGKVVRLQPFGAFVELEPGIDGLIHLADLSLKRIEGPEDVVKVGDSIDVVVAHVDQGSHKIGLHPALQGEAANEAPQRVQPHKPVKVKVHLIESGGLIVRIMGVTGRHGRGYIPAGGTGTPRGTELRKAFSIGQELEAKVIEIDPRRGEVKLSVKALSDDQERSAYQQYRQQVKAEARFTFADLLAKSQKK